MGAPNLARSRSHTDGPRFAPSSLVVSQDHEFLVELFRRRPELARELLRLCANIEIPGTNAETASMDITQVAPTEYRADAVIVMRDANGRPIHAVVVEVQLYIDRKKQFTWPVYVAGLRARLECPVTLLVIAREPAVAAWASRQIIIGIGMSLFPRVVSFADVPAILEPLDSRAQPELSIISALAHEDELGVVRMALEELRHLPEDEQHVYFDLLNQYLPEAFRRLEMDFKNYEFKGEIALRNQAIGRERGRDEGRVEGRDEGRVEGRVEGRDEGRRQVLCMQIATKFGLDEKRVEARLVALDSSQLAILVGRILTASTLEALFEGVERPTAND
jgi:hypothetical protein